jgi:AraC-like DNA-binding protein
MGSPETTTVRIAIPLPESDFSKVLNALSGSRGRLTRNDAAKLVHLSPSQFSRQFKQVTGTSFRRVQIAIKIRYGRLLLVNTDLPVSSIAQLLGYSDPAKFRLAFQRLYGVAPVIYRAKVASKVPA